MAIVDAASDAPSFAENVLDKFEHAMETEEREMQAVLTAERPDHHVTGLDGPHSPLDDPGIPGEFAYFGVFVKHLGSPEETQHPVTPADLLVQLLDASDADTSRGFYFHSDWNKTNSDPVHIPAAALDITPTSRSNLMTWSPLLLT